MNESILKRLVRYIYLILLRKSLLKNTFNGIYAINIYMYNILFCLKNLGDTNSDT